MVVKVEDALAYLQMDISEAVVERKIRAIESLIRSETNNNFQDRTVRFKVPSCDGMLIGNSPYLAAGDTVEISDSVNRGLYVIVSTEAGRMNVDKRLHDSASNTVTKVVYPEDVQEGVLNMLQWDFTMRGKVGIKTESLSRHSVTYYDMDDQNSLNGYPASLIGFLEPYRQMRW
ncbi:MAG: hypothetical protein OSJ72_17000 [Lachnospiraceae bacterium]|nr:hypothetical protein [Lachnospiraceae bacterium]